MVSPKEDASTSDEQVEELSREYNIQYKVCARLIINILSTRVDLYFSVQKLELFLSNHSKVHFEVLVHLLIYIRDTKNLGLKYYAKIEDAPLSEILR